jgi:transposase
MDSLTLTYWQRRHLEQQLRSTHDARLFRRILAILEVAQGAAVSAVAKRLRITPRVVYYWIETYARDPTPASLRDNDRSGRPTLLEESDRYLLRELLCHCSPQELGYFASQWTVPLLQDYLARCLGRRLADDTVRRELQRLGYTWKRSRYTLDPDPEFGKKKEAHPPANPTFVATKRHPGGGRNRPVTVPTLACGLVAQRTTQGDSPQRSERPACGLRSAEFTDGPTAVAVARTPAGG